MSRICSVCLESTNRATPLYWKHGNMWSDTGLSEMLKSCENENIKIQKKTETCALHVMCNRCIYKTCLTFFTKINNTSTATATQPPAPLMQVQSSSSSLLYNEPVYQHRDYTDDVGNHRRYFDNQDDDDDDDKNVPIKIDYINKLNENCLSKIFIYLSYKDRLNNVEQVCQRWREICKKPLAWCDVTRLDSRDIISEKDFNKLLVRAGARLEYLAIDEHYQSSIMDLVKKYCHNLTELILYLDYYDEEDFIDAFTNMTKLVSIDVKIKQLMPKTCPLSPPKILQSLHQNIEKITFSSSWIDASRTIYYPIPALDDFVALSYLKIIACDLDSLAIDQIKRRNNLVHLELLRCKISDDELLISDLPKLEHFELEQSGINVNEFIINIRYESENIKHLGIGGITWLSETALNCLSKLRELKYLDIGLVKNLNDGVLMKMSRALDNLEYVNIRECRGISEAAIKRLVKQCLHLKKLDISETGHSLGLLVSVAKIIKRRSLDNTNDADVTNVLVLVTRSSLITRFYKLVNVSSFTSSFLVFHHHPDDEPWGYNYDFDYQDSFDSADSDDDY